MHRAVRAVQAKLSVAVVAIIFPALSLAKPCERPSGRTTWRPQ